MSAIDLPRAPLTFDSLEELLRKHKKKFGEKEAIITVNPDTLEAFSISYEELDELVHQTAGLLAARGIKKDDRFAILLENTAEVLLFELAGHLLGATAVPLDLKRDTFERKLFKLKDTGSKALFSKGEELGRLRKVLPNLFVEQWKDFAEFKKLVGGFKSPKTSPSLDSHYLVLYTSGTTALPKGTLLSSRACFLNAMGILRWQSFNEEDRFNIVLPLHHINSSEFCLSTLFVGGTIILNTRYSASKFWDIVSAHRATNTSIVPTILHDLLVRFEEFAGKKLDISALRRICIGSAPVLPQETLAFYEKFGIRVIQGYGQTETALRVSGVPTDVDEDSYLKLVRTNTIGTELANNRLAIMDEDNNEKKEKAEGEISVSGPVLADGYLNSPEETKKAFKKGWFHSGDLGYWKTMSYKTSDGKLRRDKFYFIIGRIKEIIIKGGVNISPAAIEDALLKEFPEIEEISVVGYSDERMGEEIAAVIVPKKGTDKKELKQRILERTSSGELNISPYEAPRKVFFLSGLPKTSTNKIQRVEVKKMIAQLIAKEKLKHFFVRRIKPQEKKIIAEALAINNERFPGLPATLEEFRARAKNGLLFGAFEEKEGLVGSISCLRLKKEVLKRAKTWDEATAAGSFENNDAKGDVLVCAAISVRSSRRFESPQPLSSKQERELAEGAKKEIEEYLEKGLDHVIEFHRKPKGGIGGAEVWRILPEGRPGDLAAMGYNILMKYPDLDKNTKIVRSNAPSPSVLLIEHTFLWAKENGIRQVFAFSRPSGFREYLLKRR